MLPMEVCLYSYLRWFENSLGPCVSFVVTDEFSVRVTKTSSRIGVSWTHSLSFYIESVSWADFAHSGDERCEFFLVEKSMCELFFVRSISSKFINFLHVFFHFFSSLTFRGDLTATFSRVWSFAVLCTRVAYPSTAVNIINLFVNISSSTNCDIALFHFWYQTIIMKTNYFWTPFPLLVV